jgi:UDP-N-acetylglucosamine 2-epimerase (non-hydrolysing)
MKKILFVFGTRPEAIKLAPLIIALRPHSDKMSIKICTTGQQRELLDQVLDFFSIIPDYDLGIMSKDQSLFDISRKALKGLEEKMIEYRPDYCLVQGDTTTACMAALAAFYRKIKIIHLEAGLRSGNKYHPYPEEVNRKMISAMADIHLAPTRRAMQHLKEEKVSGQVFLTGNTVVDALLMTVKLIMTQDEKLYYRNFDYVDFSKKIILVTGHRRESFGEPLENICGAILEIADHNEVEVIYPVHLNPNVLFPVKKMLGTRPNIHLVSQLSYPHMVWIMSKSHLIISDSGGIQEEAPTFNIPVIVTREVTERQEGIESGMSFLTGSDKSKIVTVAKSLLDRKKETGLKGSLNPYGDGKAVERIIEIILKISFGNTTSHI